MKRSKMPKLLKIMLYFGSLVMFFLLCAVIFLFATKNGRLMLYQIAASQIHSAMEIETEKNETIISKTTIESKDMVEQKSRPVSKKIKQDFLTFLIFGIEENDGAKNTDSMMLVTLNLIDGKVKVVSLLRDTYVDVPDYYGTKLNHSYALGGTNLLIDTIELNYKVHIDGYAWVDFKSFEEVIDLLGGIELTLTSNEAEYLNTTNYISNPIYRNVKAGKNLMNGNQVLGYCRVRYRATSTGNNNDYGRTERQRVVLDAIFKKYKEQHVLDMISVAYQCLKLVKTNVTAGEIAIILESLAENRVPDMDTFRLPVDGLFIDPEEYNGVTYPLVLDWEENIMELYKFMYDETAEEAEKRLDKWEMND